NADQQILRGGGHLGEREALAVGDGDDVRERAPDVDPDLEGRETQRGPPNPLTGSSPGRSTRANPRWGHGTPHARAGRPRGGRRREAGPEGPIGVASSGFVRYQ